MGSVSTRSNGSQSSSSAYMRREGLGQWVEFHKTDIPHKLQMNTRSDSSTQKGYLAVHCYDGSILGILELQPKGKKIVSAKAFNNGLQQKKKAYWL